MAFIPPIGSVVAFQSNPSVLQTLTGLMSTNASIITVGTAAANQSVSGTVQAQLQSTNASVITVSQSSIAVAIVSGSVAVTVTPPANQSVSGTIQADIRGSVATVIIGGSIAASFTSPANQSVSGAVSISNFPTTQNVSGSVVAFQGTSPWQVSSSIAGGIFPISGSVAATITNTNINVSGSVVAFLGNSTNASVITVGTAAPNQSVSGTVQVDVRGSVAVAIISGSVAVATGNSSVMLLNGANTIGSVIAYQGSLPWAMAGSVAAFQAGTQITSLVSTVPSSVIVGASIFGQLPGGTAVLGSVATLQGTNPWTITGAVSVSGTAQVQVQASIGAVIIGGSIATATTNSSVMLLNSANTIGSVIAYQGAVPWAMSGSVAAVQIGTRITSVISANPSSMLVGASILGQLPAGTAMLGSVAVYQGAIPWAISGSVAANFPTTQNVSGSVVATQGTNPWVIGSIVGTYSEDVQSTGADKGLFTLGIRNDTVASLIGTDLDYTGWSTDSAGRHLVKPFAADEVRLDTVSSTVSTSVAALFNSVVGLRNYVTDIFIANTGSTATLVTFKDGSTSVLGFTIAPAGGGSNIIGMNFPMRTATSQDFTYVATNPTSVLYVTAKGYKAP